jgi:hypothetical protein
MYEASIDSSRKNEEWIQKDRSIFFEELDDGRRANAERECGEALFNGNGVSPER